MVSWSIGGATANPGLYLNKKNKKKKKQMIANMNLLIFDLFME